MADPQTNKLVNMQFEESIKASFMNKDIEKRNHHGMSPLDKSLIELVKIGPDVLQKKLSFLSKVSQQEYYFIDEKDEQTGLEAYNRSLSECITFLKGLEPKLMKISWWQRRRLESIRIKTMEEIVQREEEVLVLAERPLADENGCDSIRNISQSDKLLDIKSIDRI